LANNAGRPIKISEVRLRGETGMYESNRNLVLKCKDQARRIEIGFGQNNAIKIVDRERR